MVDFLEVQVNNGMAGSIETVFQELLHGSFVHMFFRKLWFYDGDNSLDLASVQRVVSRFKELYVGFTWTPDNREYREDTPNDVWSTNLGGGNCCELIPLTPITSMYAGILIHFHCFLNQDESLFKCCSDTYEFLYIYLSHLSMMSAPHLSHTSKVHTCQVYATLVV